MRISCSARAVARANSWSSCRTWWTDAPRGRAPRRTAPRCRLARRRGRSSRGAPAEGTGARRPRLAARGGSVDPRRSSHHPRDPEPWCTRHAERSGAPRWSPGARGQPRRRCARIFVSPLPGGGTAHTRGRDRSRGAAAAAGPARAAAASRRPALHEHQSHAARGWRARARHFRRRARRATATRRARLTSEFSVPVRGELNPAQLEGILNGALDSGAHLAVERCEAAGGEGRESLVRAPATRGASGKEVRQLFERQGALVSRVLRTHLGPLALERILGRGRFRSSLRRSWPRSSPGSPPPAVERQSIGRCGRDFRSQQRDVGAREARRQRQRREVLGRIGLTPHRRARAPGIERVDAHVADALELRRRSTWLRPSSANFDTAYAPSRRAPAARRRCWRSTTEASADFFRAGISTCVSAKAAVTFTCITRHHVGTSYCSIGVSVPRSPALCSSPSSRR